MRLMDSVLVVPGQPHPAVAEYLPLLRQFKDRDTVLAPIYRSVKWKLAEATDPTAPAMGVHTFTRSKAAQSFYPDLGAWVWIVWTDELGRSVADDAEWIDNPDAFFREPFNV